jgi:hypothetical protein
VVRSSSIAVAETTNAEIATRAALITNEVLMPAIKEKQLFSGRCYLSVSNMSLRISLLQNRNWKNFPKPKF